MDLLVNHEFPTRMEAYWDGRVSYQSPSSPLPKPLGSAEHDDKITNVDLAEKESMNKPSYTSLGDFSPY